MVLTAVPAPTAAPAPAPAAPTVLAGPVAARPSLAVVGSDVSVPLVTGGRRRYANFDHAASAPCLRVVRDAVEAFLPWYASVHRGAGYLSQVATDAYEGAREAVHDFVGARADDVVVLTRNTTDSLNLLRAALPADTQVIGFAGEHHANLLPWRRGDSILLPLPDGPEHAMELLATALGARDGGRPRLVAVTGASNVTGEIWPYERMAALAHRYGARIVVDAAQLAPHRRIDLAASDVDYLVFSGHKLYAPFGAGVLVGRPDWLGAGEPFLAGGGAVRYVGTDTVLWADLPDRQEAGSPNVIGAVALGVACRALAAADRDRLEAAEDALLARARVRLAEVPGLRMLRLWAADHPRIGVLPFTVEGIPYSRLAAILSAEYGIGVRHGCFCAHPLMATLLGVDRDTEARIRRELGAGLPARLPGAVRASLGLATRPEDVERLGDALMSIVTGGARWTYRSSPDGTDCRPDPDPRPRPVLPFPLAEEGSAG